jgi:isoamylase
MSTMIPSLSLSVTEGTATPLGASCVAGAVNFAIYAGDAASVSVELRENGGEVQRIPLVCKTGRVWHGAIHGVKLPLQYTYRVDGGASLLDPYATEVIGRSAWGVDEPYFPRGVVRSPAHFDWQGVARPGHLKKDLVVYELHVRGFTVSPTSGVENPGTYLGLINKIPYLKDLGVNAVELLPVHEFDEREYEGVNPETGERLLNYWGYSPVNFFAPMQRYAVPNHPLSPPDQFRQMVRELHRAGIEVILDVVFNHTSEGERGKAIHSYRGLDESIYYMLGDRGDLLNFSGCGNTFNANHPIARQLVIDCLKHWVAEYKIDGFRFDLASTLGRGTDGTPLESSPLIDLLSTDPLFADTKLIAEPWDAAGLYQVGSFFPEHPQWAEWNGPYRDCVRRFIKGDRGQCSEFATRVSGSEDLYGPARRPYHSVNFVTAHDGFTLRDLVSYSGKHNGNNGEENRDGSDQNDSWNCGVEGETENKEIRLLRQRQMKNLMVALLGSQGVPMIQMGDEYGHSREGNNNGWCQDNPLTWFDWEADGGSQLELVRSMIDLRRRHPSLTQENFLTDSDVEWLEPSWEDDCRFVAWRLRGEAGDIVFAFNAGDRQREFHLPPDRDWKIVVDTGDGAPVLGPYSALVAEEFHE